MSYKLVSKLLANRLKVSIDRIISPQQSAFVPGRNIEEDYVLAQEIIDSTRKKQKGRSFMGVKVHMSKTYYRIDWKILNAILKSLRFSDHFRRLRNKCISTIHYALLIYGRPAGSFKSQKGLRQGILQEYRKFDDGICDWLRGLTKNVNREVP